MNQFQKHLNRMKQEGFSDIQAFVESFDYAVRLGHKPKMSFEGTHVEFEQFTAGFDKERVERVRNAWKFTDDA